MAQKIVRVITKTRSFMCDIAWEDLRYFLACNGDRKQSNDRFVEDHSGGKYHWEFEQTFEARHFCNLHEAIEFGWKLLAPPIYKPAMFEKNDTYEWWLVRD